MARIIVKRGDVTRYDDLYKTFSARVPVTWDRRRAQRRKQDVQHGADERRTAERRGSPPPSWTALGFVVTTG
jgi:hypothetical protein